MQQLLLFWRLGALFLLFVLLFYRKVASHSLKADNYRARVTEERSINLILRNSRVSEGNQNKIWIPARVPFDASCRGLINNLTLKKWYTEYMADYAKLKPPISDLSL